MLKYVRYDTATGTIVPYWNEDNFRNSKMSTTRLLPYRTVQLVQTFYHTYVHHSTFTLPHRLIFGAQHHPRRTLLRITIFSTYRVQSTDTGTLYTSFISSACQPLQKLTSSTYLRICTLCMYVRMYVRSLFVRSLSFQNKYQKTS